MRLQLDTITSLTNLVSTLLLSGIASDATTRVMYKVPRREALWWDTPNLNPMLQLAAQNRLRVEEEINVHAVSDGLYVYLHNLCIYECVIEYKSIS